jgi:hypothetical protein
MEAAGEGVPVGKGLGLNPIVADQISSKANQMEAHGADWWKPSRESAIKTSILSNQNL